MAGSPKSETRPLKHGVEWDAMTRTGHNAKRGARRRPSWWRDPDRMAPLHMWPMAFLRFAIFAALIIGAGLLVRNLWY